MNNYETQTIQIFIEVYENASEILLYVNSTQRYDSDTIQVEVNQFLNVTVFYTDNLTKQHLTLKTNTASFTKMEAPDGCCAVDWQCLMMKVWQPASPVH